MLVPFVAITFVTEAEALGIWVRHSLAPSIGSARRTGKRRLSTAQSVMTRLVIRAFAGIVSVISVNDIGQTLYVVRSRADAR